MPAQDSTNSGPDRTAPNTATSVLRVGLPNFLLLARAGSEGGRILGSRSPSLPGKCTFFSHERPQMPLSNSKFQQHVASPWTPEPLPNFGSPSLSYIQLVQPSSLKSMQGCLTASVVCETKYSWWNHKTYFKSKNFAVTSAEMVKSFMTQRLPQTFDNCWHFYGDFGRFAWNPSNISALDVCTDWSIVQILSQTCV